MAGRVNHSAEVIYETGPSLPSHLSQSLSGNLSILTFSDLRERRLSQLGWVARSLMPGLERCAVIITRGYASSTESPSIVSPLAASTQCGSGLLWSLWLPRLSCHSFSDHESAIGFQIYLLCFDNLEQVEKKCMNPKCHHPWDICGHLPSARQLVHN